MVTLNKKIEGLSYEQLMEIAKDTKSEPETMLALTSYEDVILQDALAKNPAIPLAAQNELLKSKHPIVWKTLAQNQRVDSKVLNELTNYGADIRIDVAMNENVGEETVKKLATHEDSLLRIYIARKKKLTPDVIDALSRDKHDTVRSQLAERNDLSDSVLKRLAGDDSFVVRQRVAKKKDLHVAISMKLASDPNWGVRKNIAENPTTPGIVLEELGNDQDTNVQLALAENEKTPGHVLEMFGGNSTDDVAIAAIMNPNASDDFIAQFCELSCSVGEMANSVLDERINASKQGEAFVGNLSKPKHGYINDISFDSELSSDAISNKSKAKAPTGNVLAAMKVACERGATNKEVADIGNYSEKYIPELIRKHKWKKPKK